MSSYRRNRRGKVRAGMLAIILVLLIVIGAGFYLAWEYQKIPDAKLFNAFKETPSPAPTPTLTPTSEPAPTPVQPTPEPTISPEEIMALEEAARAEAAAKRAEAAQYSFYQKLQKGYGVNVLVLGDASAMDSTGDDENGIVDGPKFRNLSKQLKEKYIPDSGEKVTVTNLANTAGNILCDIMRVNNMPGDADYDLIILSYGINDQKNDVLSNFEALILSLRNKFPDCSVICTIEPCFHGITTDFETMINECGSYEIPVINLFSAFYEKGQDKYLDYFEENQTIPNEKGVEEWIRLICETVDKNVGVSTGKMAEIKTITTRAEKLSKLRFIPVSDSRVSRKDDKSYSVEVSANGMAYIQHEEMLGRNDVTVIADDILYALDQPAAVDTPSGAYIIHLHDEFICKQNFSITFASKELADGLEGFYIIEK